MRAEIYRGEDAQCGLDVGPAAASETLWGPQAEAKARLTYTVWHSEWDASTAPAASAKWVLKSWRLAVWPFLRMRGGAAVQTVGSYVKLVG